MNWFGRKAASSPARPALSRVYGSWSAPAPLSWEAQVRAGYLGNAIVQRSVRLIAEAAGAAPLTAGDPALLRLVAATSGGQGLVETLASQLLLHGNGYVQRSEARRVGNEGVRTGTSWGYPDSQKKNNKARARQ